VSSNDLNISAYCHCGLCLEERPDGVSPRDWGQLEVGFTREGIQVWGKRHEVNVIHINFQGQKHPADMTRRKT